ncbi:hypothetical protein GV792_15020 [Nocardia cyriacigeorgica]|uniref:hypothetical protein n=1 Tax=Nocardia cyriacigeorgica TaxID=135487 RepID=UPI0013B73CCA|nr:hypothetical protein [Nocardia cyriacigeorgica]NEW39872.1 hypothetical protein [Nocardia cyriacigeorgica]NEW51357.1 hypothetical protein [Nocardia cyriacigeorgica]
MLTASFAADLAAAEELIKSAPHVRTEQDLLEGYQYLAGSIIATLHAAWAPELAAPLFISGAGPFIKQGLDNPDTLYFNASISDNAEYVVTGKRGTTADLSFQVLAGQYTDTNVPASVAAFDDREIDIAPDGSFELRFGPHEAAGRRNYITLAPGSSELLVREVYSDWTAERGTITIARTDTAGLPIPPLTTPTVQRRFTDAGAALLTRIRTWLQFPEWFYLNLPVNTLIEPRLTPGGLATQYSSVGHYDLADDEAMIITVPCSEAPYQGFQLGSMWYLSLDYVNHQTSLTSAQSQVDPDGKIRLVVSERDPGVTNWLETVGHSRGYLQFRWQRLSRALTEADGPTAEIVTIDQVAERLPYFEHNKITPEDFTARIAARQSTFAQRMLG